MNNPLRYAGETFYQSSFEPGKNLTILQVVRNGGWMIPYLSCMIVGVGMTLHMGANLSDFLRGRCHSMTNGVSRSLPPAARRGPLAWLWLGSTGRAAARRGRRLPGAGVRAICPSCTRAA